MPFGSGVRPPRWQARPVTIEAMQYTPEDRDLVELWMTQQGCTWWRDNVDVVRVLTPQGSKPVQEGEWLVRGTVGEWYPVADQVFRLKYRSTEEGPPVLERFGNPHDVED